MQRAHSLWQVGSGRHVLPIKPLDLLKTARSVFTKQDDQLRLGLFFDPRLEDVFIDHISALFAPATSSTRVFAHVLAGEVALTENNSYDAAVVILQTPDIAHALVRQAKDSGLPVLIIAASGFRKAWSDAYDVSILDAVVAREPAKMAHEVAVWFAENLSDKRGALARGFLFMRKELADRLVLSTTQQNAVVAAVPFVPGADITILTLNEVKMVLQLALMSGQKVSLSRALEVAVVIAAALGARFAARVLIKLMPFKPATTWIARAAVSAATTWLLGQAARAWYKHNGDLVETAKSLKGRLPLPAKSKNVAI
jgi:uncharacterized protein (DUF697 family)